jgi:pimeloyl-ACP methyl ester carboxylesterase
MEHLGVERAILVGHSLGGGVSMQFAYQFPQRCAGLVLVSSGGLGREASLALRAATLPGSELVLPVITHERTLTILARVTRGLARTPWPGPSNGLDDAVVALRKLQGPQTRKAFLASLRSVVDVSGQRVQASVARFAGLPVLVVWGDRDAILPISHGRDAVREIPGARLVVFPGASHEPHRFDPDRFADLLLAQVDLVLAETELARVADGPVAPA